MKKCKQCRGAIRGLPYEIIPNRPICHACYTAIDHTPFCGQCGKRKAASHIKRIKRENWCLACLNLRR